MKKKTWLSWSSGKDSAWALHTLRQNPEFDVTALFTVVNAKYQRAAMHATRLELLKLQAAAAGLPLHVVEIPNPCAFEECNVIMGTFTAGAAAAGVQCMAFGDLFLTDIREYREKQLAGTGIEPIFPLWLKPTPQLAREMLAGGLRSIISCVDTRKLPREFAGREWDAALLAELPPDVDPCAENGEFHTIAVAGPMFRHPLEVRLGEFHQSDTFVFRDVIPG